MADAAPARSTLVPKAFFGTPAGGLDLFVDALGVRAWHHDAASAVVERAGARANAFADTVLAAKDRRGFAAGTDALHADIAAHRHDLLHSNLPDVTLRPWGARESALRDRTGVCIVFRPFD